LLGKNTESEEEAINTQGRSFRIASPSEINSHCDKNIFVAGYGYNSSRLTSNYAQQISMGKFLGLSEVSNNFDSEVLHMADTEVGNSGSPLIVVDENEEQTNILVGIHTGGRCNPMNNNPNKGTGFSNQDLLEAVAKLKKERG
jgi:hypothetical protein